MQFLVGFELPKFSSEGRTRLCPGRVQVPAPSARTCTSVSAELSSTTARLHDPLTAPLYALIRFSEPQPPA